ncbi:MAG: cytochrome P450 [Ramlibacter sp.]|nr:cytochrome P450 [Ramlibacter sp.]
MTQAPLRQLSDVPGPPGIPVLGNALQITLPRIHQDFERWAREYGPMYRVKIGPREMLVISDHAVIGSVLRDRPEGFRRSTRARETGREMGLPPGVFAAEGDAWRNQRRMVMASFSPSHVRAYFPSLQKVTQRLQGRWLKAARAGAGIELQPDLMRFTVDAIAGLAFGAEVNTLESDDDIIQQHLDKIFPALFRRIFTRIPYWRFVRLPADRQLDRSVKEINRAIAAFIAQARQRLQDEPARREQPPNLLEAMIVAADEPGSGLNDTDIAGNVLTMLLAGEDTTANSLAWMVYLLHRHPQALHRAQDEVRALATDPAAFTIEQMASLDYLDACAQETMRLKPVAPNLPVEAIHDTVVGGVAVPANTLVWSVLRHDSVDDRHFPNGSAFMPERWLESESAGQQLASAKRVSMPFGGGPRVCPGRYLALLEMKMAMAMLLTRFEIVGVDTPDGGEAQELMSFTMSPVGLRMRLRERQS